jgi:hypothetical protein
LTIRRARTIFCSVASILELIFPRLASCSTSQ